MRGEPPTGPRVAAALVETSRFAHGHLGSSIGGGGGLFAGGGDGLGGGGALGGRALGASTGPNSTSMARRRGGDDALSRHKFSFAEKSQPHETSTPVPDAHTLPVAPLTAMCRRRVVSDAATERVTVPPGGADT